MFWNALTYKLGDNKIEFMKNTNKNEQDRVSGWCGYVNCSYVEQFNGKP